MDKKEMKSQIQYNHMYKHSFGHCSTQTQAARHKKYLQEKYPKKTIHVVQEKRSNNKWPKYCVCEYVPFKRDKDKVKKSNLRRKDRDTHKDSKHTYHPESK